MSALPDSTPLEPHDGRLHISAPQRVAEEVITVQARDWFAIPFMPESFYVGFAKTLLESLRNLT